MQTEAPPSILPPHALPNNLQDMQDSLKKILHNHEHSQQKPANSDNPKKPPLKPSQKKVHKKHADAGPRFHVDGISVGMSEETCFNFDTPMCQGIDDMCSVIQYASPNADISWCTDATKFCKIASDKHPDFKAPIRSRMCTELNLSEPTCTVAKSICAHPNLNSGAFCSKINQLCTK